MVRARTVSIASDGTISSDTSGSGKGGAISISINGELSIDGSDLTGPTGISSAAVDGEAVVLREYCRRTGSFATSAMARSSVGRSDPVTPEVSRSMSAGGL